MTRRLLHIACLIAGGLYLAEPGVAQQVSAPKPQPATVVGTALDINGGIIPGATIVLRGAGDDDTRTLVADDSGSFEFRDLTPGVAWRVTITAKGFADWTSDPLTLRPGQYLLLTGIQLRLATVEVVVTALTPEQIATEQVRNQETQRVLGIVPDFYVNFDQHPQPMTSKLKYQLALKTLNDPVTLGGFLLNASFYQAAGYPSYSGGMKGYGQRLGATVAGGYGHIFVGDALLPSLFHQDPRFFYQDGTAHSRLLHGLSTAIFTVGDNGRRQFNYSGIGGDLASGALANAYYPPRDRGAKLALSGALIGTGGRVAYALAEEFLLNKPSLRHNRK
jgi:hypothetical protein